MFLRIIKNFFFKNSFCKIFYLLNFTYLYFFTFYYIFNFSFFFLKNKYIKYPYCFNNYFFIFNFFNYFYKLNLYKYEFLLDGLYYRIKYYKQYKIIGFIIGYSNYIYYNLPKGIQCFVHKKKRRFFLYSLNLNTLTSSMLEIVNLKQPNLFKGKGIKYIEYIYRKKEVQEKKK